MIKFEKAKLVKNEQAGKKGLAIHTIGFVAQVTEESAKALGDDVRNTLYNSKGVIRPSFSQMDTTHAFGGATVHLSIAGVKGAELRLADVLVHRFRIAKRGDGEKKPKTLVCGFKVEYVNKQTGTSSIDLWNFVNSFIGGQGALKLTYPEQQAMFTEGKKEKEPEIVPGLHKFTEPGVTAEIRVLESKGGWTSTRKANAGARRLPQKPGVERPSEAEALAMAAYDVRAFADKAAGGTRGKVKEAIQALSKWAGSFAEPSADIAKAAAATAGKEEKPKTVPITRHTN